MEHQKGDHSFGTESLSGKSWILRVLSQATASIYCLNERATDLT